MSSRHGRLKGRIIQCRDSNRFGIDFETLKNEVRHEVSNTRARWTFVADDTAAVKDGFKLMRMYDYIDLIDSAIRCEEWGLAGTAVEFFDNYLERAGFTKVKVNEQIR